MTKFNYGARLFACVAITAISGCTLEPHYTRPVAPIPTSFATPAASGSTLTGDQLAWRQVFKDPRLQQLIELALRNNRDLQVAALDVEKAHAEYGITSAALAPTISAAASGQAQHLPGGLFETESTGPATYHMDSVAVGFTSYELDVFGRVRSLRHEALQSYLATAEARKSIQLSLVGQVATAYLTLCADNDLLQLAQQMLHSQQQSYDLVKLQYQANVATEQDLVQAESTVRSAQADVASYQRQRTTALDALNVLLGTQAPADVLEHAHLDGEMGLPEVAAGLTSNVLLQRPDVKADEDRLKAASADIGAARAAFFPSISLTADGGSLSGGLSKLFDPGTGSWTFTPNVSLPIFTGGRLSAQLKVSKTEERIAAAQYQKAIQVAFREVVDALVGTSTYRAELDAREKDAQANAKNFKLAQDRYAGGIDSYVSVLIAQRLDDAAQTQRIQARLGLLTQRVALYQALGGGYR